MNFPNKSCIMLKQCSKECGSEKDTNCPTLQIVNIVLSLVTRSGDLDGTQITLNKKK